MFLSIKSYMIHKMASVLINPVRVHRIISSNMCMTT
nr:unnamed protein product [Callosobruchus analis]